MDKKIPAAPDMDALIKASQEASKREQKAVWDKSLTAEDAWTKLRKAGGKQTLDSLLALRETAWDSEGITAVRYPRWQFDRLVLPYVHQVIEILREAGYTDWRIHSFLVGPNELLGESPLDVLRAGGRDAVLEAARVDHESF